MTDADAVADGVCKRLAYVLLCAYGWLEVRHLPRSMSV